MAAGERPNRASRIFHQPRETWAPGDALKVRHDENLEDLLIESIRNLSRDSGIELCVTFTRQPWLDRDARALPVARREWNEIRERGFDLLWWINPASKLFYCFSSPKSRSPETAEISGELEKLLPTVTRMLSEELGVTHPLRATRLAIETLRMQLPKTMDQAPSQRA